MLKQKFILDFSTKFIIQVLTTIAGIIVARIAGPEVIGTVNYGTSFVGIFTFFVGIFGTAHIKMVSEGKNEGDCNKTYFTISIISVIIFLISILSYYIIQKYLFNNPFSNNELQIIVLLSIAAYLIGLFPQFNELYFNARIEQAKSNIPSLLNITIYNISRIIVVIIGFGAIALVTVKILSGLLVLPFIFIMLRKIPFGKFNIHLFKRYLIISIPMILYELTNTLMKNVDKLILEYYNNVKEIGYYTAALSIGGMILLMGKSAGTVFFPLFSKYFAKNDYATVRKLLKKYEDTLFKFILPIAIVLSVYSSLIINLILGPKYHTAISVFSVLVLASFIMLWATPYGNILEGLGKFWIVTRINIYQFVFFAICLFCLLDPRFFGLKSLGLAINTLLTNIIFLLLNIVYVYRKTNIYLEFKIKYLILATIMFVSWYYLCSYLTTNYLILYYISPFGMIVVYMLTMYILKWLDTNDIKFLFSIFNPKSMTLYIKREIKGD